MHAFVTLLPRDFSCSGSVTHQQQQLQQQMQLLFEYLQIAVEYLQIAAEYYDPGPYAAAHHDRRHTGLSIAEAPGGQHQQQQQQQQQQLPQLFPNIHPAVGYDDPSAYTAAHLEPLHATFPIGAVPGGGHLQQQQSQQFFPYCPPTLWYDNPAYAAAHHHHPWHLPSSMGEVPGGPHQPQ